jgi:urease accessory protein UreE
MTNAEYERVVEKITDGVKLAIDRLVEKTKKEDGDLVISQGGKIVRVKARDLRPNKMASR